MIAAYVRFVNRFWTSVLNAVCDATGWDNFRVARVAMVISVPLSVPYILFHTTGVLRIFDFVAVFSVSGLWLRALSIHEKSSPSDVINPASIPLLVLRRCVPLFSISVAFIPVQVVIHHWAAVMNEGSNVFFTLAVFASSEIRPPSRSAVVRLADRLTIRQVGNA